MIRIQSVRHWIPAALCAFDVYVWQRNLDPAASSQYILIGLPFCFFYVGAVSFLMQKQIWELQAEVKELRSVAMEVRDDRYRE
jgi:hypothetical protein